MNRGKYRKRDRTLTQEYMRRSNGPLVQGSRISRATGRGQHLEYEFDGKGWHVVHLEQGNNASAAYTVVL